MIVTWATPVLARMESTFPAISAAVVAFDFEKSYEKVASSELCQPSALKRPTIVVHVVALAFQPCTNRMMGWAGGGGGGARFARGSTRSVMDPHAASTVRAALARGRVMARMADSLRGER